MSHAHNVIEALRRAELRRKLSELPITYLPDKPGTPVLSEDEVDSSADSEERTTESRARP